MLIDFGYIALFLVISLLFVAVMLLLPVILRFIGIVPKKPSVEKNSTFECGMPTIGKTWVRFNFRYYFFALIFLVLDVFAIFLFPWVTDLRNLGSPAFIVMLVFIIILVVGYIYAWKKKVLEWK
jgi:NADH-quinone oxidoreductase subunit A